MNPALKELPSAIIFIYYNLWLKGQLQSAKDILVLLICIFLKRLKGTVHFFP